MTGTLVDVEGGLNVRLDGIRELAKVIEKSLPEWAWKPVLSTLLSDASERRRARTMTEEMWQALEDIRSRQVSGDGP